MRSFWYGVICLALSSNVFFVDSALPGTLHSCGTLLQQMKLATQSANYDMAFISINNQGVRSLLYRHAVLDNQIFSQLLELDGPRREVVQHGDKISYFEPGLEPVTFAGDYIVDSMPSLIYADFKRLALYYDFVAVGRARIADRLCDVIRIVARDGTRYNYIVWVDSQTKLPMQVNLVDHDGETLEQFRVISFTVNEQPSIVMKNFAKMAFPPQLIVPPSSKVHFNWVLTWLPQGFNERSQEHHSLPGMDMPVESRFYSDGLFSFSVNISDADRFSHPQLIRTGRRLINTEVRHHTEITIVGGVASLYSQADFR